MLESQARRIMKPGVALIGAAVMLGGCQAQNPYALFGSQRVPTPGMQTPAPYYPANASAAPAANSTGTAASGRLSVSASAAPSQAAVTISDAGDKQPIQIVENPAPAARTANTGATRSAGTPLTPAASSPASTAPLAPTSGKSSRLIRTDSNVAPASYEQAAAPSTGWRVR
jgi:hypothetical protein